MLILAKLIGIAMTIFGLTIFASPEWAQKVFCFFKEGRRIYYAGIIRVLVGLLLIFTAAQSASPLAVISLGLLFLISGIVIFSADVEKMKAFITHYSELPQLVIRLMGLIAACFGVLIFAVI